MNEKRIILGNIEDYDKTINLEEYEKNNGYSSLKKLKRFFCELKDSNIIKFRLLFLS